MKWLLRLLGIARPEYAEVPQPTAVRPRELARIAWRAGSFPTDAVGESFYQQALETIAGGYNRSGHEKECDAIIALEPTNQFDPNAVRIEIVGRVVGYLSRDQAQRVGGAMKELGLVAATCRAQIRGGWRTNQYDQGHFGVRLAIPSWGQIDFGSAGRAPAEVPKEPSQRHSTARPKPSPEGPLAGFRIALMGASRDGELAQVLAAAGARIVAGVGQTTSHLVVCGDEPPYSFGTHRSTTFVKAQELQAAGSSIKIVCESEARSLANPSPAGPFTPPG